MPRLPLLGLLLLAAPARADVAFGRDVLPVLADNCFHCHGPDPNTRAAGLRLDTPDVVGKKRRDRVMIAPGHAAESEVIRRIVSADADEQMPPPDSHRKLTPAQIDTLKKWVDEGAKWGKHWSLEPLPASVPVPPGYANPIDAFVRERLKREKLSPAPPAPPELWLRRVTFDLTGLPPTPAELQAFLQSAIRDPQSAMEAVVDRLLDTNRYAERMASDWLDVARFADTHGYQHDRPRDVTPYRDWVLNSFRRNQPFDRFLTEQLAGDIIPGATRDQKLATAFNRLHMQNEEGGIVEEEFRVAYVVDRVNTMGTAFLGLTFECCRCHDHKYDPLTQRDFYQLFALFQNVDEAGQTPYFTSPAPTPALPLPTDAQEKEIARLRAAVAANERAARDADAALGDWSPVAGEPPDLLTRLTFDDASPWANGAPNGKPASPDDAPTVGPGRDGKGLHLSGENGLSVAGLPAWGRGDPFTLALWMRPSEIAPRQVVLHRSKAPVDAGSRGVELLLENGRVAFGLHHMWPGDALKVRTTKAVPVNAWTHVAATHDGSGKASGVRVFIDGQACEVEVIRDDLRRDITGTGAELELALGQRFRDSGFRGGAADDVRAYGRALTATEVARVAGKPAAPDRDEHLSARHAPSRAARDELRRARGELARAVTAVREIMAMEEMPRPKPAFVLKRGAYDTPGDAVTADTPKVLPPFPVAAPRNRLGLARWLTEPSHPLTARVTANRLWQQMFGTGIVETSDNFGTTGAPPTHPELLDWLARDFVAHGWDVRRALKQMALSDTYRQSSRMRIADCGLRIEDVPAATLVGVASVIPQSAIRNPQSFDPYNRLLARAPVRRLSAEMLRDQALAVSGLLAEKWGGASVYPYQPEGLWLEAMGRPNYPQSKGADLYRRSVYTFWKRTAPPPQLTTFDAADRSNCSARRQSTSTPLQSLALLNDPQITEAARFLGQRMLKEGGDARAAWGFALAVGRDPTEREAAILAKLWDEQRAWYAARPDEAKKLLAVGATRADASLPPAELAAASAVALALLNHDEAVNRR